MYKRIAKRNRIVILNKLGISSLEFNDKTFNSLMLHCDGLVSISSNKRIPIEDRQYDNMTLLRYEEGNKSWRYCIGYLSEYNKMEY